jgi:hypothetical protein
VNLDLLRYVVIEVSPVMKGNATATWTAKMMEIPLNRDFVP